ncbi:MAG: hypothetical protein JWL72_3886 [Ilumatobacteraceae bacterium]|nr:hypothetical protein [Ilumatobacteraceae bacterium]
MCFSATADIVGGVGIAAIGVDVLRHVNGRRDHVALAALPLLLGLHQIDEAFVWWGLQGHVDATVGHVATWIYLVFAFVVLPVYLPAAVWLLEPKGLCRRAMAAFAALGAVVSALLLVGIVRGPTTAELSSHHLNYVTNLHAGRVIVVAYVLATCGSLLFSGFRNIALFGIVNLVAVAVLAELTIDGFASLWCGWAAICSGAFALHLRSATPPSDRWHFGTRRPSVFHR